MSGYTRCHKEAKVWTPEGKNVPIYFSGVMAEGYETGDLFSGFGYLSPEIGMSEKGFLITKTFNIGNDISINSKEDFCIIDNRFPIPKINRFLEIFQNEK